MALVVATTVALTVRLVTLPEDSSHWGLLAPEGFARTTRTLHLSRVKNEAILSLAVEAHQVSLELSENEIYLLPPLLKMVTFNCFLLQLSSYTNSMYLIHGRVVYVAVK